MSAQETPGTAGVSAEPIRQDGTGERKFGDYYTKWDAVAADAVQTVEEQEEREAAASTAALGLDSDAPQSEAEAKDRAKREALKECKKQWDGVEQKKAEQKMVISGETGQERALEFEGDLSGRRVLVLKECTDCAYELPPSLDVHGIIKLYIEGCERCTVNLHCKLVTSLVEVCHCDGCTIEVRHPTHTFQVDLCESTHLWFGQNVLAPGHKVYSAGNRGLRVTYDDRGEQARPGEPGEAKESVVDNFELSSLPAAQAAEQQFVTQLTNLSRHDTKMDLDLQTEMVARDAGQQPTTQREIQDRKDEIAASLKKRGIDDASIQRAQERLDAPSSQSVAEGHKDEGNKAFKERHYMQASVYYMQAIKALELEPKTGSAGNAVVALLCACHSNRAACQLKLGDHQAALADAKEVVALDPTHVKGLFRQGLALHALKRYREACPLLGKALSLQPKNQQIKDALMFAERNAAKG